MNTINLVLGDWSHDGHNQTDTVTISCNLTRDELQAAYERGSQKIGFNLTREVAAHYEENKLDEECVEALEKFGFDTSKVVEDDCLWTDGFVKIWLFVVGLGEPDFVHKIVKNQDVRIGGYGLFT